jgi:hypothetical protein
MALPAPARLTDADELPGGIDASEPLWSENYCSAAYDPEHDITLWLHTGRTSYKSDLWHEIITIGLPTGKILAAKGFGRGASDTGPGASTMFFECIQPWNRWRMKMDGAGVLVTADQLEQGLLADGVFVPADWELEWTGAAPTWDVGAEMAQQTWGRVHYSQVCRVVGEISCDGSTYAFSGSGLRDHTRGRRDFRTIDRHVWLYGYFPGSRRTFQVLDNATRADAGGHRLAVAAICAGPGQALESVELVDSPMLPDLAAAPDGPFRFSLRGDGRSADIAAVALARTMPYGLGGINENLVGKEPDIATHYYYESFTTFEWDGEVGYGLTERSVPVTTD